MNNLDEVLSLYCNDIRISKLNENLNHSSLNRILLYNLIGAQQCFVLSGAYTVEPRSFVVIASDKEEAAYIQNTLSSLLPQRKIHFLSDSFKRPMKFDEIDSNNMVSRTEIINKISNTHITNQIIVSYPEALFEKVVDPFVLEKTKISIKEKEKLDVDTVIGLLIEYGFERADFVYEPGFFSIRGSIIDIFTYGNEWPYRIDLYDDEVESIRLFDPATQLSVERQNEIHIIPNIKSKFKQNQKISLLELFDKNSVLWICNGDVLVEKLQICFEKAEDFAGTLEAKTNEEIREIFEDRAFMYPADIIEQISKFHQVRLTKPALLDPENVSFDFEGKPQPSFNKNFSLLIEHLFENSSSNTQNIIFTESEKQIERFENIFKEHDAEVKYSIIIANVFSGFIDTHLNVAFYTDHQIFERFHRYKLKQGFSKDQALSFKMIKELEPGDFVVHMDHGVGRFSGLEKIT
ncbi:MAG: hypothetical protein RLZZ546_2847, partial [Bacteroidota bacterium]